MSLHVRTSGVWRRIYNPSIRTSAVWRSQESMWVRTSGVWRNFRPDVDSTFTAATYTSGSTRYIGFALAGDPWTGSAFGTQPPTGYRAFGNHNIEGIYSVETFDTKIGWLPDYNYVVLAGTPAAGLLERGTWNGSTYTSPVESTSGTYRRFRFTYSTFTNGSETFRLGGD
jgi:hypothetical protein